MVETLDRAADGEMDGVERGMCKTETDAIGYVQVAENVMDEVWREVCEPIWLNKSRRTSSIGNMVVMTWCLN